jgi:hypothetical protein
MKTIRTILFYISLLALAFVGAMSRSDDDSAWSTIEKACAQAGFTRGLANKSDGKDLDSGCLQPILKGQNCARR